MINIVWMIYVLNPGEKGELARWVIQLQTDLDRERRKVGNSPVIPDTWIPVSERMPGKGGMYLVWNGKHIDAVPLFFGSFQCVNPGQITHWRRLPAAQQEVK